MSTSPLSSTAPPRAGPLYTRVHDMDPERSAGSEVSYKSFGDFLTTFHAEANDPDKVGMADFLDIVNPLQHLPIIGAIYREITGDTMKPGAEMMGGAVFGGGAGLAAASVKVVAQEEWDQNTAPALAIVLAPAPSPTPALALTGPAPVLPVRTEPLPPLYLAEKDNGKITDVLNKIGAKVNTAPVPAATKSAAAAYTRITMTDPERTAGSIAYYA